MPPKCRFTKEEIISAAVDITREKGFEAVSARSVGARLGSSQNVIFSSFENMDELREAVLCESNRVYQGFLESGIKSGKYTPYKASGMAYIRFAAEEKELFRLLFMRDRTNEQSAGTTDETEPIIKMLQKSYGLKKKDARQLHLQMWIFVHGIASMLATGYVNFDEKKTSGLLSVQFEGMKAVYNIEV